MLHAHTEIDFVSVVKVLDCIKACKGSDNAC